MAFSARPPAVEVGSSPGRVLQGMVKPGGGVVQAHCRRSADPQRSGNLPPTHPTIAEPPHLLGGDLDARSAARMLRLGEAHDRTSNLKPKWSHGASVRSRQSRAAWLLTLRSSPR